MKITLRGVGAGVAIGAMMLTAACAPPSKSNASGSGGDKIATAGSAEAAGGMDALVAAAKKEGQLNVIALPPDWANYGEMISTFSSKYGIKVQSANPAGTSQDEINAVNQLKGTSRAPDVLDVGAAVAVANTSLFAPYKVATDADIPAGQKDANGAWTSDYGGYMSVGYDSSKVPAPTSVKDLLKPAYKNKVALNGDPTQANAALNGVLMASIANGGSADDISKGVDFFKQLKQAKNFVKADATPATEKNGTTPVVFDWDYLNAQAAKNVKTWKVFVPQGALVAGYYSQAINKQAPHPAAARLWEEFLYSDQGQNLWLKGLARPVRMAAMTKAGTIDAALAAKLPKVTGTPITPTDSQATAAKTYLAANWAKAIG